MDCMKGVRTIEVTGVAWNVMPWTIRSVEQ